MNKYLKKHDTAELWVESQEYTNLNDGCRISKLVWGSSPNSKIHNSHLTPVTNSTSYKTDVMSASEYIQGKERVWTQDEDTGAWTKNEAHDWKHIPKLGYDGVAFPDEVGHLYKICSLAGKGFPDQLTHKQIEAIEARINEIFAAIKPGEGVANLEDILRQVATELFPEKILPAHLGTRLP